MSELLPFAFIVVMFAGLYFLLIRPARQRQQEAQRTISQVAVGQRVMTTAGIFGTISEVSEDTVGLQVAPGVELTYAKAAIAKILDPLDADLAAESPDDQADERP